jgi:Acetyltransferases, including N-acetylases of ribosomal proteins
MIQGEKIVLRVATLDERKSIYDMGMKTNILRYLDSYDDNLTEFENDYTERYFDNKAPSQCGGMIICKNSVSIGFISYGRINRKTMELDIWLDGELCCGKGFGPDAIVTLSDYLHLKYSISTFIMVPSRLNYRAIRAYEKSGFKQTDLETRKILVKQMFTQKQLSEQWTDYLDEEDVFMIKEYNEYD